MDNKWNKFMMGRYGSDQLTTFLLIISLLFALIGMLADLRLFTYFSYLPLGIAIFRVLSRNTAKRSMENYKFIMLIEPIYKRFNQKRSQINDLKTHRYYKCPSCRVTLRVPKGKGKIKITCPKCKSRFTKDT
jgi:hypothetical protein